MKGKGKKNTDFREIRELYQLLGQAHVKKMWRVAQAISDLIERKRKGGALG